jgi:hypothetical protein
MDTKVVYTGETTPYTCTLDISHGMKYGLLQLDKLVPADKQDQGMRSFISYINDDEQHRRMFSHCDGGQLMYNVVINGNGLLWNGHLGAYEGIMSRVEPKPKIAILGIAGRANHDGRPFDGSAAQFAVKQIQWLDQPEMVIWCMHDDKYVLCFETLMVVVADVSSSCIPPHKVDVAGVVESVGQETRSKILDLTPGKQVELDI